VTSRIPNYPPPRSRPFSVIVDGRVRVSADEGVRQGVFAGLGIAVASEWMFAPELKSGAIKSVLDDWSGL
jgi:DNA-binding transcriptional LysR family regulator